MNKIEIPTNGMDIKNNIQIAKAEAPFWREQELQTAKDTQIFKSFFNGEINLREFNSLFDKQERRGLLYISLEDMRRYAAELGFPPFGYEKLIEHESNHVEVASRHGLISSTGAQYAKKEQYSALFCLYTFVHFPEDLKDDSARQIIREIASVNLGDGMDGMDKAYLSE